MTFTWTTTKDGFVDVNMGAGSIRPALDARAPGVSTLVQRVLSWRSLAADIGGPKGVPLAWTLGFIYAESGGDPNAVSDAGARGLMQVMPTTAIGLGFDSARLFEPAHNIGAGTSLLADFRGDGWDLPCAASMYNAGPSPDHPGPKTSTKSPWGLVENTGYITKVVAAQNYFRANVTTAATSPSSSSNSSGIGLGLVAIAGLAWFGMKGGARGRA